jgi:hypothetical protein
METRRLASAWRAIGLVLVASGVVLGQQPQPEVVPPPSAPYQIAPSEPAEEPPPAELVPEAAPPGPPKGEAATDDFQGFGRGGAGFGGLGMGGMGMFGTASGGPGLGGPGYSATWYPSTSVSGAVPAAEFGLLRQSLSGALPVWRSAGDLVTLSAGVRETMFFTDAVLPDSHRPFPSDLWNVTLGTTYLHKFDDGWLAGGAVSFGSASDKPFYGSDTLTAGFMSFLQVPVWDNRDAWRFSLAYSPVGNLNFPIPGVAYLWNPTETFHACIGLPFALMWRPEEDLTFVVSYMPIVTVNARVTYRLAGKLFVYGGFESAQESYLLADRVDVKDRFLGFEKRVLAGIRWDVGQFAAVELSAGYAFDRYYGTGVNEVQNLQDEVNIAPGAFVSARFQVHF